MPAWAWHTACMLRPHAPATCMRAHAVFYWGFAFLPWLWFTSVWLFWHEFRGRPGCDPEIRKCELHKPPWPYMSGLDHACAHVQLYAWRACTHAAACIA